MAIDRYQVSVGDIPVSFHTNLLLYQLLLLNGGGIIYDEFPYMGDAIRLLSKINSWPPIQFDILLVLHIYMYILVKSF